ncbi:MAG TPA: polysaccharide deacetylase family protein [Phototrophicaceae bacterium]|nr:polysaccharide deacetylase family protein [Phototrophicaceae bacterium]
MNCSQPGDTNQLLGYPADARLLIINADDFGMCHATNTAIQRALTEGAVTSTTVMVPCPWAIHALHWLRDHPAIPFGIHLTVVGDNADYRWRPVSCREQVPSLVDETGHFYTWERIPEFVARAQVAEVEIEFRAQIETVLTAGLKPTHLDWHSLRIHQRPDIFEVMFKLAREYGLALRVRERPFIETMRRQNLPCNDYDFLDSYGLETAGKLAHYIHLLRELPAGLSEWAVHPGLDNAELHTIEPEGAPIRQADLDCMIAPEIREVIRQEGIILLSYQPLQTMWQTG